MELVGEDELVFRPDLERLLPATDPLNRQIVMGCGAFLELFDLAARANNRRAEITLWPEGEPRIEVKAFHKDAIVKKCRMTDEAIARKEEWCKAHHKKGKTIMSVVNDVIELYERDGFGNFRKENMKFIGKFENPNRGKD